MNGDKFIYVFTKDDRDKLLDAGMKLLNFDEKNGVYIFLKEADAMDYSLQKTEHITTNTLSF